MRKLAINLVYLIAVTGALGAYAASPHSADALDAGLVKVKQPVGMDEVWLRPGFDPSRFSKIMVSDVAIEYRAVKTKVTRLGASSGPYEIEQNDRDKLQAVVSAAFADEVKQITRYQPSEIAGPETIKLEVRLQDVVSSVPPQSSGRIDVYLAEVGRATLVMDLKDSSTGEILMRGIDRRAAETFGTSELKRSSSGENWSIVKRLARTWAKGLRKEIDEMKNVGSALE